MLQEKLQELENLERGGAVVAEESAACSEELTVQAETLNKMIGQFEIK